MKRHWHFCMVLSFFSPCTDFLMFLEVQHRCPCSISHQCFSRFPQPVPADNKAQNCANLLWALTHQGKEPSSEGFICALAERASQLVDWDEQSLSISVWALAVLGQRSASLPLLASVPSDLDKLRVFSSESLSVFAWTCGLLGVKAHPTPMLAIIVRDRAETLTVEHATSILLAFARIWPQQFGKSTCDKIINHNKDQQIFILNIYYFILLKSRLLIQTPDPDLSRELIQTF